MYSRSARDLIHLAAAYPAWWQELQQERPLLAQVEAGRDQLEQALDAERRALMRANEERLAAYAAAAQPWSAVWQDVAAEMAGLPLAAAHRVMVTRAEGVLPFAGSWRPVGADS